MTFWATWCGPCLTEMPSFAAWEASYGGRGLQVIGVSMDDTDAPVRAFLRKQHLNYPVVMGDADLGELYGGVLGLPVTYLIDRSGIIRFQHQGAKLTPAQLTKTYDSEEGKLTGVELLMALLDHTTHHRASAEMYLRTKGITPVEYEF